MLDVAIIGGGPAALSAALNCKQRNKTVTIFGRSLDTSFLFTAEKVDNYLGLPEMNGEEMLHQFHQHAVKKGVTFQECRVSQILSMGEHYVINAENNFVEAKTVILATGINKSKGIEGEAEFLGKGVSYCATCDGMLYRGKNVIVVSENSEGEADANFLQDICSHVTYIPLYEPVTYLKEGIEVKKGKPEKVEGQNRVTGIVVNGENLPCDGLFFIKNTISPDSLLFSLETENGYILVNRRMETNLKNVFAAGDCTGGPFQIAKAVGEGLIAALSAATAIDQQMRNS